MGVISLGALAGVAGLSLGMVLTPGPNMAYLVSRTLTQGRRAGLFSLAGVAVGFVCYLCAANLGLSVLFVAVPSLYLTIKLAGALYLGWLAWKSLKPGGTSMFEPRKVTPELPGRLFTMGLVTNLLNPKVAVIYLSLLPQFINPAAGNVVEQGFLVGAVQIGVSLTVQLLIVLGAGAIAAVLTSRPLWLKLQRYLMGTVLGALAVKLATDRVQPAIA